MAFKARSQKLSIKYILFVKYETVCVIFSVIRIKWTINFSTIISEY